MYWNKPLFEQEGLPDLYELYESNEWTWEVLLDIARKTTRDTTGDGEIDQFGLVAPDWIRVLTTLSASNDYEWLEKNDGRTEVNLTDHRLIETLEFLQLMHSEGLISTTWLPLEKSVIIGPTIGHMFTNNEDYAAMEFGLIPTPRGPSASEIKSIGPGRAWGAVIPITTKHDPKAIVEVMSALWQTTEPYITHMSVYKDMDDWRNDYWFERMLDVPDAKSYEIWQWIEASVIQPFDAVMMALTHQNSQHILRTLHNDVVVGGQSATSALAQMTPEVDDLFEFYRHLYDE